MSAIDVLDEKEKKGELKFDSHVLFILITGFINSVMFTWTTCFIHVVKFMTLASSFSTWHGSENNNQVPKKSIRSSLSTVLK